MAEKTEKATPKKLRDARKKGQVAKSQDFPSAFTFVTSIFATLFGAGYLFKNLGGYIISMFHQIQNSSDLEQRAGGYLREAIQVIMTSSFPIVVVVAFVGVIIGFLTVGPVFSAQAMKFEFKRLNPVEGIKQKFKLKVLIELIKSILKIVGAALIIYFVIWDSIPEVVATVTLPALGSAWFLNDFLTKIAIRVGIFFLLIAIFDLAFQKKNFAKEMMMEKFEVKQEYKDTEGDPMIKGKRREAFREIAYQEGPSAARKAKAVVINPTHIAVALGYDEENDPAPMILTMGQGPIAEQIIKIALDSHVPIMRNVSLARDLFSRGKVSDYIPEDTYQAVAEILKWIKALEENPDINTELFNLPP